MTDPAIRIRALDAAEARELIEALSDILIDCVEGGASVSFMAPLERAKAASFWRGVAEDVAAGARILLVAEETSSRKIIGTVQVVLAQPENQPHRADLAKMLVHRRGRRQGVGSALLHAAEDAALAAGKTLIVLDTTTGREGERLYARAGWSRVGAIPGFALMPDGQPSGTTYFYKQLP